jgi:hypothetical protein
VDGRPLLPASLTEPVVISLECQFFIVSTRIVAFLPSPCSTISAHFTLHSVQQSALAPEQTNGRPSLLIAMRTLSLSRDHCLHYRRAKGKILFNDPHVHIILIMIPMIQDIL